MGTNVRRLGLAVVALAGVVTLVAVSIVVLFGPDGTRITAYFKQAVGVYEDSDVRVLGVKVGSISSVEPQPNRVKVTLEIDRKVKLPADARALVVAPSVVADRYIQLTPAYSGGARLVDGATINQTQVPIEIDQLYGALTKMSQDLGPNGLNKNGALSNALRVAANNMRGNGQAMGLTIERLGQAAKTLTGSQKDLFSTIDNLSKFTGMLRDNDAQVRLAERQLADVATFLADDRENIGLALDKLAEALHKVKAFIADNRELIRSNIDKLANITQVLVDQRASLAEALDVLPLSAGNVLNAYDPKTRSLMGRGNLNELPALPFAGTNGGGR
ncbi:MCE family protein [Thermomonospora umbrina]|uniref:Phospholipid/cholesterol/gamma-HCH transport system substrate-binding protein n=1 Tax=Thermomonospora umbrina TaxID=111806 RepID=A0A3D9STJ4_9ACTN|nr:MCE family protein [Thermomonospora umbrina]REE97810.1 phospholipid/cholesterol/gamma-HCH transport system substrate-binding protein [Thermomonospora umbrina]